MENIDKYVELENIARVNPLALLVIKDPTSLYFINSLMPFSTGIEIECIMPPHFSSKAFEYIPKIMSTNLDSGEQRFRFSRGLNGLIALYLVCNQLKENSVLNPSSGIHYHVDMTDTGTEFVSNKFIEDKLGWVLGELDRWEYKGKYNPRAIRITKGGWLGFRYDKKTAEFRCGEQSFDYTYIVDKVIHANDIIRRIKILYKEDYMVPYFEEPIITIKEIKDYFCTFAGSNKKAHLQAIYIKQKELEKREAELRGNTLRTVDVNSIIKSRTTKLG